MFFVMAAVGIFLQTPQSQAVKLLEIRVNNFIMSVVILKKINTFATLKLKQI